MMNFEAVRTQIDEMRLAQKTWRAIGGSLNISGGLALRIWRDGYIPRDPSTRAALGLPPACTVIVIGGGVIPDGAQVIQALQCACGQWFISNAPRRKRCFVCRPYRRHEERERQ
jgi:hypothetical protein